MIPRSGPLFLASALLLACPAKEDPEEDRGGKDDKADKADGADKAEDSKGDGGDADGDDGDDGGKEDSGDADSGESGSVSADDFPDAIKECPKELGGGESSSRVITKECGTVEVKGSYRVDGGSLVLLAGAKLAFKDGADLTVGYGGAAKLIVRGTQEEPVVFTAAGDQAAGVWKGVRLSSKAHRSEVDGLVVEYAGDRNGAVNVSAEDVVFKNSTIKHAKEAGLVAETDSSRFAEFSGNTFEDVGKVAMRVTATAAGDIAADNEFGDAEVHVKGGRVVTSTTWHAISAPFVVVREVRVEGKDATRADLDLEAGAEVLFDGDASMIVGYGSEGGLRAKGTADKPVVFAAHERKEAGEWRGIAISSKGEAELEHVQMSHGGKRDKDGVLLVDNRGRATIENVKFSDNTAGVVIRGNDSKIEGFANNSFSTTLIAVQLPPHHLGALGEGNKYEGEPRIVVSSGSVKDDQTMTVQEGAKVELEGALRFDGGTHTFPAGYELHIKDGARIQVGYGDIATLVVNGTADKPVRFVGLRDEPGSWKNLTLHSKAKGIVLEHLVLRNAGDKAGVVFEHQSEGKVDHLTCEKCEGAALQRHKDAKVEASDVKAAEGTPSAE